MPGGSAGGWRLGAGTLSTGPRVQASSVSVKKSSKAVAGLVCRSHARMDGARRAECEAGLPLTRREQLAAGVRSREGNITLVAWQLEMPRWLLRLLLAADAWSGVVADLDSPEASGPGALGAVRAVPGDAGTGGGRAADLEREGHAPTGIAGRTLAWGAGCAAAGGGSGLGAGPWSQAPGFRRVVDPAERACAPVRRGHRPGERGQLAPTWVTSPGRDGRRRVTGSSG